MPHRACSFSGCPAIVERGTKYCPKHEAQGEQLRSEYDRQHHDPQAKAFYDSATWQRLRRQVLTENPVCQACRKAFARECDHIVPLRLNPGLAAERSNLHSLCSPCHSAKSGRERR